MSSVNLSGPGDAGLEPRRAETMGGLAKGLAIIEIFGSGQERLTVADAARHAGMTRPAARRCLLTLEELGYLQHDGKYFTPRARLRRLGGGLPVATSFAERAQPVLEQLCEQLNEPVSLAVLDGRDSLFIGRAESHRMVSTGVRLGGRLPAYCSATGRILLGALEDDEIDRYLREVPLVARTPRTLTDRAAILRAVQEARADHVACSDEELEIGMRSVAVSVLDRTGEIIAACSISTAAARVSLEEMRERYVPLLREAAARISLRLSPGD